MKKYNPLVSIKGKQTIFPHNLQGKPLESSSKYRPTPLPLKKLKRIIINKFIIPIHSKNWQSIQENYFLLERIQHRINRYKKSYPEHDLDLYEYLINFIKTYFEQHYELEEMEGKIYGVSEHSANFATLIFKTPIVRLKAEYEIYNLLYGKPNKKQNETYDILHLNKIIDLLKNEDITFEKIKKEMAL